MSDVGQNMSILSSQTPIHEKIQIVVGETKGIDCLAFVISRNQPMKIVMTKFALRLKCPVADISLFYNGQKIEETDRPVDLGIGDQDFVQLVLKPKKERQSQNEEESNIIIMKVVGIDGTSVDVQMAKTTVLMEVFETYCNHKDLVLDEVKFVYKERVIHPTETPEDIHYVAEDIVEVMNKTVVAEAPVEDHTQVFGTPVSAAAGRASKSPEDENVIGLKVVGCDDAVVKFRVKRDAPLGKLIEKYCEYANVDENGLRFMFDQTRINKHNTPIDLEMEEGDSIDVFQMQDGGFLS